MDISLIIPTVFLLAIASLVFFLIKDWKSQVFTEFESVKIKINGTFIDIVNLQGSLIAYIRVDNAESKQIKSLSIIEESEIKYIKDNYKQIYEFYKNK